MPQCQAWTHSRPSYARNPNSGGPGGQCARKAAYVNERGAFYCAQHAKQPATVLRKATGRLQAGMRPLTEGETP